MSSMRYQPVLNPERLQMEGNVYNPEQMDDLGPIINEGRRDFVDQIGLREIFYDARMRAGQRAFCIGSSILIAFVGFIFLLLLIVGFSRVLRDIDEEKENSKYGLQIIPDLRRSTPFTLQYSLDKEGAEIRKNYVEEIDKFLDIYAKEQQSRQKFTTECKDLEKVPNKWCRMSLRQAFSRGDDGCFSRDSYGYDNGEPCILFALKDEIGWKPVMRDSTATEIPFQCAVTSRVTGSQRVNITYFPPLSTSDGYGSFPLNKLPSRTVQDSDGKDRVDDEGETLYDLPALVFIKFKMPVKQRFYTVSCSLVDDLRRNEISNLDAFHGQTQIKFDVHFNI